MTGDEASVLSLGSDVGASWLVFASEVSIRHLRDLVRRILRV